MTPDVSKQVLKFWGVKFVVPGSGKSAKTGRQSFPRLTRKEKIQYLADLDAEMHKNERCGLKAGCTNMVFGEGDPGAEIMFVGEAPGFEEDQQGRPFVGRAGQLLNDIITKGMGLKREQVYIGNVIKCRPPQNRTPTPEEVFACVPYLIRQLQIIHPKVIVGLGASAVRALIPDAEGTISRIRGHFFEYHLDGPGTDTGETIQIMPTFHPAYLLRNPAEKAKVWDDIKKVMAFLNIPIPIKKNA